MKMKEPPHSNMETRLGMSYSPSPSPASATNPVGQNISSPTNGTVSNRSFYNHGESPIETALEMAQRFSMLAVRHTEEVRRELFLVANVQHSTFRNEELDPMGYTVGVNKKQMALAFQELSSAYDKLSSLKWDAVKREYEEMCRISIRTGQPTKNLLNNSTSEGLRMDGGIQLLSSEKDEVLGPFAGRQNRDPIGSNLMKRHLPNRDPKEYREEIVADSGRKNKFEEKGSGALNPFGDIDPHGWITDAFVSGTFSTETITEAPNDLSPSLASNAGMTPLPTLPSVWSPANAAPPPGFGFAQDAKIDSGEFHDNLVYAECAACSASKFDEEDDTQSTSFPSEISSLHTSSHLLTYELSSNNSQQYDSDSISCASDLSPCLESPSPQYDIDFVYRGGYATRIAEGRETQGIVPRTVKHVVVEDSVKFIEEGAFQGCTMLESIIIPATVVSVGDHAFRKCSALKNISFLTNISSSPGSNPKKETKRSKEGVRKKEKSSEVTCFSPRGSVTSYSHLRTIGDWAFFNCSSLITLKLPHGIERIGTRAFQRCSSLSEVFLPNSLISVGENAFHGCPRESKVMLEIWEKERLKKQQN